MSTEQAAPQTTANAEVVRVEVNYYPTPETDFKNEPDSQWDSFESFVKKIAQVPKEEVDALRAEHEREKKEKQAG